MQKVMDPLKDLAGITPKGVEGLRDIEAMFEEPTSP
jgi:hypothetical protein